VRMRNERQTHGGGHAGDDGHGHSR
jgi:hypothetical protein